jgi:hypothetical protein
VFSELYWQVRQGYTHTHTLARSLTHSLVDAQFIRLIRVDRYLQSFSVLAKFISRYYRDIFIALYVGLIMALISATIMVRDEPEEFTTIPLGMYWSYITMTTIGYGDFSPKTPSGRALTVFLGIIGMIFLAIPSGLVATVFALRRSEDGAVKRYEHLVASVIQTAWRAHCARKTQSATFQHYLRIAIDAAVRHREDEKLRELEEKLEKAEAKASRKSVRPGSASRARAQSSAAASARPSQPDGRSMSATSVTSLSSLRSAIRSWLRPGSQPNAEVELDAVDVERQSLEKTAFSRLRKVFPLVSRLKFYALAKRRKATAALLENSPTTDDVFMEVGSMRARLDPITSNMQLIKQDLSRRRDSTEPFVAAGVPASPARAGFDVPRPASSASLSSGNSSRFSTAALDESIDVDVLLDWISRHRHLVSQGQQRPHRGNVDEDVLLLLDALVDEHASHRH